MKSKAKRNLTTRLKSNRLTLKASNGVLKPCQDTQYSASTDHMHASWPVAILGQPSAVYSLIVAETRTRKSFMQGHLISVIEQFMTEVERE